MHPKTNQTHVPVQLGATLFDNCCQFAIFSRHASQVWLMLFNHPDDLEPTAEFALDPNQNRIGDIWHITLNDVGPGQCYLYRMDGPHSAGAEAGHRFNPAQWLLDPYARVVTKPFQSHPVLAQGSHDLPKCVVAADTFDWQGDKPLKTPQRKSIIYEAHLRGLTKHPSANVTHPGTYRGLIELIPTLQKLGITAVELLPIHAFDHAAEFHNPTTGECLKNYWGYDSIHFFAPEPAYSADMSSDDPLAVITELKEMVREFHKAGLEIILDVVYNHTGEGGQNGSITSFKGIDNTIYYMLEADKRGYKNYSGTGNTLNCNHPVVQDLILDSLRYWVSEYHIDGFRFDLASIFSRGQDGSLLANPPLIERIGEDPILRDTKIIAEAWDAAGAYQVGAFPHPRWSEWNGLYRDDIRRFWLGEPGLIGPLATRFSGSSDLYGNDGRTPTHSINFITAHDGFTMNDLVSYKKKHNWANGEENRDGHNHSYSHNFGQEGPSTNPKIEAARVRRIKNLLATLMLSQGVPMLLAGDEFRRTQQGNNNAYAQDNKISWIDWSLRQTHAEIYRFTQAIIAFRKRHPIFYRSTFFHGPQGDSPDIHWYAANGDHPHWGTGHTLTCLISGEPTITQTNGKDNDALIMFNSAQQTRLFQVPPATNGKPWQRIIDTSLAAPHDIIAEADAVQLPNQREYQVQPESMVVLLTKN